MSCPFPVRRQRQSVSAARGQRSAAGRSGCSTPARKYPSAAQTSALLPAYRRTPGHSRQSFRSPAQRQSPQPRLRFLPMSAARRNPAGRPCPPVLICGKAGCFRTPRQIPECAPPPRRAGALCRRRSCVRIHSGSPPRGFPGGFQLLNPVSAAYESTLSVLSFPRPSVRSPPRSPREAAQGSRTSLRRVFGIPPPGRQAVRPGEIRRS